MTRQTDLFPSHVPQNNRASRQKVSLKLYVHDSSDKAWLVSPNGQHRLAVWMPKSTCVRDDARPDFFTVDRATALLKGLM